MNSSATETVLTNEAKTKAHIVLGSGGVRTIAYVGALEVLEDAGIEFESISACSAGSLVGAVVATGLPMHEVRQKIEKIDLRRLISRVIRLQGPFRFAPWLRWPFAKYDSTAVVEVMEELIGPGHTFGDLKISFAAPAIDLLSKRLLVYATETHRSMKVADAVRIAVGIPPLFPPHDAEGRVVLDAGIATQCPVWMVGRYDDEYPILALKPAEAAMTTPPRWIKSFLPTIIEAGAACQDQHLIDQIPRVREIEIPVSDLATDDFEEAEKRKQYLFETGRRVARQCLERWGPDLAGEPRRYYRPATQAEYSHDGQAVAMAAAMMEGFANRLSRIARKQVFISYSHEDQDWLDVIRAPLEPYVELHGLKVWDDRQIAPGEKWRKTIADALAQTRVALLLVSPGFIKSEFIRNEELRYFLDAAKRYSVKVRWLLLKDIGNSRNPFEPEQAFLDTATPLAQLPKERLVLELAKLGRSITREMRPVWKSDLNSNSMT
jgi:predicted acylesterase/phospholipase RssA